MQARDLVLSSQLSSQKLIRFLRHFGFENPERADSHLQSIAESLGEREPLADFSESLLESISRTPDPDAALLHLAAYFEVSSSPLTLLSYLREQPPALEALLGIFGASPFLAQSLLRNPEYLYWLSEDDRLNRIEGKRYFSREVEEAARPFHETDRIFNALRRVRRRETLRIAAQDILGRVELPEVFMQISFLAEAILQQAFRVLSSRFLPSQSDFVVLAMGKLGGRELNFSSDIDLVYICRSEEGKNSVLQFARKFTQYVGELSDQGRLYRVDLRLRPMGQSGEMVYSLSAARHYYDTWADTAERLAFLKCRCVAGDRELGAEFLKLIEGFVYKKYLDLAAVEEIRWLKRRIDSLLVGEDQSRNIKLGIGGIREIEFFVQTFQLLYGGANPRLRHTGTLETLDSLLDEGLLPSRDYRALKEAYLFLRRLEHRLQLVHDLQTHRLPEDSREFELCARRMGYSWKSPDGSPQAAGPALARELQRKEGEVHRIFVSLFKMTEEPTTLSELVLSPELNVEDALMKLKEQGVTDPEGFLQGLQLLTESSAYPYSPGRLRNLVANLAPQMIRPSRMSAKPEYLFARLDRFCDALGSRVNLYTEMVENEEFGKRLLPILASGDFLSETLIQNPELLDSVLLLSPPRAEFPALEQLVEHETPEARHYQSALRLFKRKVEFKTALYELFEPHTLPTRRILSQVAVLCLDRTVHYLLEGVPQLRSANWALMALGKLGGEELTFHSDLDLILVYDEKNTPDHSRLFNQFVRDLCHEMDQYTEFGPAYKLDFRLRPEGEKGPLATPLGAFQQYFQDRAQSWERLAYVKLRPVVEIGASLDAVRICQQRPLAEEDRRTLDHVRRRKETEIGAEKRSGRPNFKVGQGGLLDIQFIAQFLQSCHRLPEHRTFRALEKLEKTNYLDSETAGALRESLSFLNRLETVQRLMEEFASDTISGDPEENTRQALFLGLPSGQVLLEQYRFHTRRIRRIYDTIFSPHH